MASGRGQGGQEGDNISPHPFWVVTEKGETHCDLPLVEKWRPRGGIALTRTRVLAPDMQDTKATEYRVEL